MYFDFIVQNWHLIAALVVIVALILIEPIRRGTSGTKQISAIQLPQLISHENAVVVDVSEAKEFANGHIPNAINLPLGQLKDNLNKINKYKDKPVVLTCVSGNRSNRAVGILKRNEFSNIYTLKEGLIGWKKENLPVEK